MVIITGDIVIIVIKITLRLDITSSCSRVNETLIYETMIVLGFSVTVNNYSVMSGLRHRFPRISEDYIGFPPKV